LLRTYSLTPAGGWVASDCARASLTLAPTSRRAAGLAQLRPSSEHLIFFIHLQAGGWANPYCGRPPSTFRSCAVREQGVCPPTRALYSPSMGTYNTVPWRLIRRRVRSLGLIGSTSRW